jgi:hypothetical protein
MLLLTSEWTCLQFEFSSGRNTVQSDEGCGIANPDGYWPVRLQATHACHPFGSISAKWPGWGGGLTTRVYIVSIYFKNYVIKFMLKYKCNITMLAIAVIHTNILYSYTQIYCTHTHKYIVLIHTNILHSYTQIYCTHTHKYIELIHTNILKS